MNNSAERHRRAAKANTVVTMPGSLSLSCSHFLFAVACEAEAEALTAKAAAVAHAAVLLAGVKAFTCNDEDKIIPPTIKHLVFNI